MHYKLHLLLMLLVIESIAIAQPKTHTFTVHFNNDEHVLDQADLTVLDDLVTQYQKSGYAEIFLTAHTDDNAGNDYNLRLSKRRANSVSQYLTSHHINPQRISSQYYGENKPAFPNNADQNKGKNRRVEIRLVIYNISNVNQLISSASPSYKQTFTINSNATAIIKGKNGTEITIPTNALETEDGKPITSGNITVELEEFLKPEDAAFNQLSTTTPDGRQLESGGMFSIHANLNGQKVRLKKGKSMIVKMPSVNIKNDMKLFTAVKNENGITEWNATTTPFTPVATNKTPVKLNTVYLKSLITETKQPDVTRISYVYKIKNVPFKPVKPKRPTLLSDVTEKDLFTFSERMLTSKKTKLIKLDDERRRIGKINARWIERYFRRLAAYEAAYAKYRIDSQDFEHATRAKFRNWLLVQKELLNQHALTIEQGCFNSGIRRICLLSDSNKLTSSDQMLLFEKLTRPSRQQQYNLVKYLYAIGRINHMLTLSMAEITQKFYSNEKIFLIRDFRDRLMGHSLLPYKASSYHTDMLLEHPRLVKELRNPEGVTNSGEDYKSEAGMLVNTIYQTSIAGFGTYNCDRFGTTPAAQMANIRIDYQNKEAKVSFYVPSVNSYIYAYQDMNGYHLRLPKNTEVKMFVVAYRENEGPLFYSRKLTFDGDATIKPEPKTCTIKEIREGLATL